ncbi:MAG: AAA family ATPase [Alphaproteobacteria bacterium]|nr:AAA family ATPase [Alphaproteobacteria bacterium]
MPMRPYSDDILEEIRMELAGLWLAHEVHGLKGQMQLYTIDGKEPWRAQQEGFSFWFGPNDLDAAIEHVKKMYNNGALPNSPLLLNPIVHSKEGDTYTPVGSGLIWATGFAQGIDTMRHDQMERIHSLGVFGSPVVRGDNDFAGLKMLGFLNKPVKPEPGKQAVPGCRALYDLSNINSPDYWHYYMLSGLAYLSKNGSFQHPEFPTLFDSAKEQVEGEEFITSHQVDLQHVQDAATCWDAYDRHHTLFVRFGVDTKNLERNLKYFNLCARDFQLFDATGPTRKGAEEKFELVVNGWIPKGATTLIAAAGGTGKSSVAHYLCILAATDWEKEETPPTWLGSTINKEHCTGLCIYFSGEDGPAIVNARAELFDPTTRAKRVMFQRTDFGEGVTFAQFMHKLHKLPNVSIVVIDPARKYLLGNEDDSDVVSHFFEAIEECAIKKGAAMVVVHHLAKGADPKSARQVLECLRGSQVFIDRPRVVIGMYRDGPYTCVGLAKCNIPPSLGMIQGERVFVRDPKSLGLVWLPGPDGIRSDQLSEEELEQIKAEAELKAVKTES